ncbi:hypothetical protein [Streptomyces sp. NPDC058701]|uniref:hypothetical protein n=1 Tax=Streptomyces sp. NPDC058701 TaxID=3346608 RepID=UPI0036675204
MSHDLLDRAESAAAEHTAARAARTVRPVRHARPVRPALLAGEQREAPDHHIFRGTD